MLSNIKYKDIKTIIESTLGFYKIPVINIYSAITKAVSYINDFYVRNDLGVYVEVVETPFYSAPQNQIINIRDMTRWCVVSMPNGAKQAVKLISCMLKEATPDMVEYPVGVSYIQDIKIEIADAKTVNSSVPAQNSGYCSLISDNNLFNVLTLGNPNSWTNLSSISAILAYYRGAILPTDSNEISIDEFYVDIVNTDVEWLVNVVMLMIYPHISNETKHKVETIELKKCLRQG